MNSGRVLFRQQEITQEEYGRYTGTTGKDIYATAGKPGPFRPEVLKAISFKAYLGNSYEEDIQDVEEVTAVPYADVHKQVVEEHYQHNTGVQPEERILATAAFHHLQRAAYLYRQQNLLARLYAQQENTLLPLGDMHIEYKAFVGICAVGEGINFT